MHWLESVSVKTRRCWTQLKVKLSGKELGHVHVCVQVEYSSASWWLMVEGLERRGFIGR